MVRPRGYLWGVDSVMRVNRQVRYRGAQSTLFEHVTNLAGEPPRFWGRFFGSDGTQVRPDEIRYLHQRNCRVLLVYNGVRNARRINQAANTPAANRTAYGHGKRAARFAIRRVEAFAQHDLAVPSSVRIYADLEDYRVHPNWLLGWFDTMQISRFAGAGGLYGRPYRLMERPELEDIGIPRLGTRVAAEHRRARYDPNDPAFEQQVDDHLGPSLAPGSGPHRRAELEALMLGDRATATGRSRYMWVNEPRRPGEPGPDEDIFPPTFSPARIGGGCQAVIWQYRANCFVPDGSQYGVDLNYAAQTAFDEMW